MDARPAHEGSDDLGVQELLGGHLHDVLGEYDEIGEFARFQRAQIGFLIGGVGGVEGEAAEGFVAGHPLVVLPAALGPVVGILAGDGGVKALDGIDVLHGEVRAEGEARAAVEERAPRVGAVDALGAEAVELLVEEARERRRPHRDDPRRVLEATQTQDGDGIGVQSIPVPSIRKHSLTLYSPADLDSVSASEGDQMKVTYVLDPKYFDEWPQYRNEVRSWAKANGVELHSIEFVLTDKEDKKRDEEGAAPVSMATPDAVLDRFAEREAISDRLLDYGKRFTQ